MSALQSAKGDYQLIEDEAALKTALSALRKAGHFALEVFDDDAPYMEARIIGLAFSDQPGQAFYVPLAHDSLESASELDGKAALALIKPLLEDPDLGKFCHDCKHVIHVLENANIQLRGWRFDSHLASYVWNSVASNHQLEKVAQEHLSLSLESKDSLTGKGRKKLAVSQLSPQDATAWAGLRADAVLRLEQQIGRAHV